MGGGKGGLTRRREKGDGLAAPKFIRMLTTKCSWKIKKGGGEHVRVLVKWEEGKGVLNRL
jgi:hypothetical protein